MSRGKEVLFSPVIKRSDRMKDRPVRVLHIIDTLGGGGSERLLWDIVRLSDPGQVAHRVITFFPDGYFGPFVYAEKLRQVGAFGRIVKHRLPQDPGSRSEDTICRQSVRKDSPDRDWLSKARANPFLRHFKRLPVSWKAYVGEAGSKTKLHASAIARIIHEYYQHRPDVIHVHGFYPFQYGIFLKTTFRRPLLHTVPCLFAQMTDQGTGWLVAQYKRFHTSIDLFLLDQAYRSELHSVGVPDEKLISLRGTVDLEAIAKSKAASQQHRTDVRTRLGLPIDAPVALSVGRLDPSKGHEYAVKALSLLRERHPNLHWILLGEGWKRAQLESLIQELGLAERAHLIGFVEEPLPFYAAADIYLRTTVMEGENISSYQAIAMGLPVVGFDSYTRADLIGKLGNGLLVRNRDAAGLAEAISHILSLPDRGRTLGLKGIGYSDGKLDLKKQIQDLATVYSEMARRPQKIGLRENTLGRGKVTD